MHRCPLCGPQRLNVLIHSHSTLPPAQRNQHSICLPLEHFPLWVLIGVDIITLGLNVYCLQSVILFLCSHLGVLQSLKQVSLEILLFTLEKQRMVGQQVRWDSLNYRTHHIRLVWIRGFLTWIFVCFVEELDTQIGFWSSYSLIKW